MIETDITKEREDLITIIGKLGTRFGLEIPTNLIETILLSTVNKDDISIVKNMIRMTETIYNNVSNLKIVLDNMVELCMTSTYSIEHCLILELKSIYQEKQMKKNRIRQRTNTSIQQEKIELTEEEENDLISSIQELALMDNMNLSKDLIKEKLFNVNSKDNNWLDRYAREIIIKYLKQDIIEKHIKLEEIFKPREEDVLNNPIVKKYNITQEKKKRGNIMSMLDLEGKDLFLSISELARKYNVVIPRDLTTMLILEVLQEEEALEMDGMEKVVKTILNEPLYSDWLLGNIIDLHMRSGEDLNYCFLIELRYIFINKIIIKNRHMKSSDIVLLGESAYLHHIKSSLIKSISQKNIMRNDIENKIIKLIRELAESYTLETIKYCKTKGTGIAESLTTEMILELVSDNESLKAEYILKVLEKLLSKQTYLKWLLNKITDLHHISGKPLVDCFLEKLNYIFTNRNILWVPINEVSLNEKIEPKKEIEHVCKCGNKCSEKEKNKIPLIRDKDLVLIDACMECLEQMKAEKGGIIILGKDFIEKIKENAYYCMRKYDMQLKEDKIFILNLPVIESTDRKIFQII